MKFSYTGEVKIKSGRQYAEAAAELLVREARRAIDERGRFRLALSGGSGPVPVYELLAGRGYSRRVDWKRVDVFWGDERYVPGIHPQSNYRLVVETLLQHVPIPPGNIYRVETEITPPDACAADYERRLRRCFDEPNGVPRLDLIYLGLGDNGHVASLFPHSAALKESRRLVVADWVEVVNQWRITMTVPLLNAAHTVAVLVWGGYKAEVLRDVLVGERDPERWPAQFILPQGKLVWFVDERASLCFKEELRKAA